MIKELSPYNVSNEDAFILDSDISYINSPLASKSHPNILKNLKLDDTCSSSDSDLKIISSSRSRKNQVIISSSDSDSSIKSVKQQNPTLTINNSSSDDVQIITSRLKTLIVISSDSESKKSTHPENIENQYNFSDSDSDGFNPGIIIHDGTPSKPRLLDPTYKTPFKQPQKLIQTPTFTPSKLFKQSRDFQTAQLFKEFNTTIFNDKLDPLMKLEWSVKLNKTAGRAHLNWIQTPIGKQRSCWIELSTKVLDTAFKLRNTLIHEMIHAAQWMIDGQDKPPHGDLFKRYGAFVMKCYPDLVVSTRHDYDIHYKYFYQCTKESCGKKYGRHSKSINVEKMGCVCGSTLVLLVPLNKDGKERMPSKYAVFVKENYAKIKQEHPGKLQSEIMKLVALKYREFKSN